MRCTTGLVCYTGSTSVTSTIVEKPIKLQHLILIEVLACDTFSRHIIKPGMETGNEMERNEINLQCSGGYSLRNILQAPYIIILTTTVLAFTDLKAQCEYRWYRRFAQGFAAVYDDSNNLMRFILHGL